MSVLLIEMVLTVIFTNPINFNEKAFRRPMGDVFEDTDGIIWSVTDSLGSEI